MEIHPQITPIEITGVFLYLIRGQKNALIDTGPKIPFPPMDEEYQVTANSTSKQAKHYDEAESDQSASDHVVPVMPILTSVLDQLGMTMSDIDYILNSHIHFDHTAGNAAVKEASGAKILIHAADAGYFEDPRRLFDREQGAIIEEMLGKEQLESEFKKYIEEETGPGPYTPIDGEMADNDLIELGDDIDLRIIHLPGHTAGSSGFYLEKEKVLIACDALVGVGGHAGAIPILEDLAAYNRTLERVQQLELNTLVHAHAFMSYTIPRKTVLKGDEINVYLNECGEFVRSLREAATRVAPDLHKKPFAELYDTVVGMLPQSENYKKIDEMSGPLFGPATLLHCINQLN